MQQTEEISGLKLKLNNVFEKFDQLEKQNQRITAEIENLSKKFNDHHEEKKSTDLVSVNTNKRLDQVKSELRGLTSPRSFSNVLNTSNPFVKFMWICFFLVLFGGFLQNMIENLTDYLEYTVITSIESVYQISMTFPATTFCLASFMNDGPVFSINQSSFSCKINGYKCSLNDVYSFEKVLYSTRSKCYALNSGRNSSGHLQEIKTTKNTGWEFWIEFYIPDDYYLIYNIHQPNIRPTKSEISRVIGSGSFNFLELEKTVETKLGLPYNNCTKLNDWQDTYYVRQTKKNNMTYRKVNCIEECRDYLNEKYPYKNKTLIELSEFNNCYNLCPLECDSTIYKISETKLPGDYSPGTVSIFLGYNSLKYTKITQSPKTKLSELISNLGGSAGLFLDLTFLSGCRAIEFILGIIFKY